MSKCLECEYYDKEKHNCPFYCQLIRETLNEAISFELEQIKAEILNAKPYYQYYIEKDDFISIFDKHISELKGKQE